MNNIYNEVDLLFDEIEKSEIYRNYVNVKEKLKSNKEIANLISDIKRMQKIVTNNEDLVLEEKIKSMFDKLNSYPLYQSYLIIKDELEDELFIVSNSFDKYFKNLLYIDIC